MQLYNSLQTMLLHSLHISYRREWKHCVTGTGGAGWKMFFGKGVKLTVEDSEYQFSV